MGLSGGMEQNTPCRRRRSSRRGGGGGRKLMLFKPLVLTREPCVMTKGRDPGRHERPAWCQILHSNHSSAGARQGSGMGSAIIPALLLQLTAWM